MTTTSALVETGAQRSNSEFSSTSEHASSDVVPISAQELLSRLALASAGSACVLVALWRALSDPRAEWADRVYFASALATGIGALVLRRAHLRRTPVLVVAASGGIAMLWGLLTVEHPVYHGLLWMGFGPWVTGATLGLAPLTGWLLRPSLLRRAAARYVAVACVLAVAVVGALSFFQTKTSLPEGPHSGYVFNEIYAVAAGHFPYVDFIPQYQTLYSYLFQPVIFLLGADRGLDVVLVTLSLLSLATVLMGVLAGWRASGGLSRLVSPLLILPLVFLTQGPGRLGWSGSISVLHSAYPVRMLLPTLVGALIAYMPALGLERWREEKHGLGLGLLLGLACYHQLDFGLAAGFATVLVIIVAAPFRKAFANLACLAAAAVGGFALVPMLHRLAGVPIDISKLGWFARQFGGGFGSEPIQVPGPVLIVLPLLVGGTVSCVAVLLSARRQAHPAAKASERRLVVQRAALVGSYFGAFSIAAFPYYLNRSMASGQLQILLMPLGVVLVALAQLIAATPDWDEQARSLRSLPFRLALAVPVASLILLPNPTQELDRLGGKGGSATSWPAATTASLLMAGDKWRSVPERAAVGYLGIDGNYVEAAIGLRNVSRISNPEDARMSPAALSEVCAGIASPQIGFLILGDYAVNPNVCEPGWKVGRPENGLIAFAQRPIESSSANVE